MKLSSEGIPKCGMRSISLKKPSWHAGDEVGTGASVPLNKPAAGAVVSSGDTGSGTFSINWRVDCA
ncbi:hypothetical protein [Sphingorhabdus sp. EL138]|uniref:hypothetical protein n=1 Tax=Sphingorhabdus sp. EL138 TaxID=2073156 RepID=UPI000D68B341|nr:hypothetical protein [Sphingorhabdus sp. EL138]